MTHGLWCSVFIFFSVLKWSCGFWEVSRVINCTYLKNVSHSKRESVSVLSFTSRCPRSQSVEMSQQLLVVRKLVSGLHGPRRMNPDHIEDPLLFTMRLIFVVKNPRWQSDERSTRFRPLFTRSLQIAPEGQKWLPTLCEDSLVCFSAGFHKNYWTDVSQNLVKGQNMRRERGAIKSWSEQRGRSKN